MKNRNYWNFFKIFMLFYVHDLFKNWREFCQFKYYWTFFFFFLIQDFINIASFLETVRNATKVFLNYTTCPQYKYSALLNIIKTMIKIDLKKTAVDAAVRKINTLEVSWQ